MIFRGVGPERNLGIFYEWIRAERTMDAVMAYGYQSVHRPTHRACQQTLESDEW